MKSGQNYLPSMEPKEHTIGSLASTLISRLGEAPRVVGIDLSGSETKASGWAVLQGRSVRTELLKTDDELIERTIKEKPTLVSIDSPLSLPKGRDCVEDSCQCRAYGISRACERELRRLGISVYWCLIQSMRSLTQRGIQLSRRLQETNKIDVIESYPGAAQDLLGIPRKKQAGQLRLEGLRQGLLAFGLVLEDDGNITHDELDAVTCAVVGYFYLADEYRALGDPEEGVLIVPRQWRR